ncbi:hypothetical protein CFC21_039583 [Triticum aestivum]|uniref:Uncharacterized protein n=2 Tax=Triticum aestivum TaxID=4565 RepID=A0A3B6FFG3_WHEAT|nr:hypothetical protein CFC21_039583 [Triticum aestivum]
MSGGVSGAASPEVGSGDEWPRIFDRVEALLPRVEELAADRARSRAHQESSEARENALHARLLQAEASRRRWKAAYTELPPGANPKLAELQENDLVDSKACEGIIYAGGSDPEIQQGGSRNGRQFSQNNEDHEDTARDLKAELNKLKQVYGTMSSKKDKEVSELLVVQNFLWNQLRTMDKDNTALLKMKEVEAAQATEAAQKVQQNVEELQVAARNKDAEIDRLRAEAANAKTRVLVLEGKLLEMQSLVKEKNDEIQKIRSGQPESLKCKCASSLSNETSQKRRKLTNEMHFGQCTSMKIFTVIFLSVVEVMYLPEGHEAYLDGMRLSDSCPCDRIKDLKAVELCRIEGLGYSAYGEICCTLALKFIDDTSSGFGKQFIITLLELADFSDFLVERTRFEATIVQNWTIRDKCKVWSMDDGEEERSWWEGHVLAITPDSPDFPESPWLKYAIQFYDGSDFLYSPWELHAAGPLVPWKHPHIDSSIRNKLLSAVTTLQKMSHKNQDYYGVLKLDTVVGESDFINRFPVQFSIEVIRARLQNDYYRTLDAVQHDATVMLANAKSCFSKSSVMTKKIHRLSEWVNDNIQSL